jgi:hypothetical protein
MFGSSSSAGVDEADCDFTALDQIMPHPVYGQMFWVCVLNPSPETFEAVQRSAQEPLDRTPAI